MVRALAQLGIVHRPSYSRGADGRMERLCGTLQGRLPQELRLAGIGSIVAANTWLASSFVPEFNARFAIKPEEEGTAFLPFV